MAEKINKIERKDKVRKHEFEFLLAGRDCSLIAQAIFVLQCLNQNRREKDLYPRYKNQFCTMYGHAEVESKSAHIQCSFDSGKIW